MIRAYLAENPERKKDMYIISFEDLLESRNFKMNDLNKISREEIEEILELGLLHDIAMKPLFDHIIYDENNDKILIKMIDMMTIERITKYDSGEWSILFKIISYHPLKIITHVLEKVFKNTRDRDFLSYNIILYSGRQYNTIEMVILRNYGLKMIAKSESIINIKMNKTMFSLPIFIRILSGFGQLPRLSIWNTLLSLNRPFNIIVEIESLHIFHNPSMTSVVKYSDVETIEYFSAKNELDYQNFNLDVDGDSLMHLMASYNTEETNKYFVKKGLNITKTNNDGDTPFDIYIERNMLSLVHDILHNDNDNDNDNEDLKNICITTIFLKSLIRYKKNDHYTITNRDHK